MSKIVSNKGATSSSSSNTSNSAVVTDPFSIGILGSNPLTTSTQPLLPALNATLSNSTPQPNKTPDKMKFNLPPHLWSRPVTPQQVLGKNNKVIPAGSTSNDTGLRLTRMWCYQSINTNSELASPPSTTTDPYAGGLTISNSNLHSVRGARGSTLVPNAPSTDSGTPATTAYDYNWGFQFLWNPTSIQTSQQRNSNVTPSPSDAFAGLAGLFTAMESISFTIVIDRVNDFACAAGLNSLTDLGSIDGTYIGFTPSAIAKSKLNSLLRYYKGGAVGYAKPDNPEDMGAQIQDLLKLGTMADIEYIYRMLNGSGAAGSAGASSTFWTNSLGKKTADVAFLQPTPIAIQFGPGIHNLSYVGYIDSMSVNHTIFTQDMIPLHTEIQVSMYGFSKTTLTSGGQ